MSDRLWSLVYSALKSAVIYWESEDFRGDWRERGGDGLAEALVRAACSKWPPDSYSYPQTFWMDHWIAQFLRDRTPNELAFIVSEWLDGKPLPPGISDDPAEEDRRVRELKRLLLKLNE